MSSNKKTIELLTKEREEFLARAEDCLRIIKAIQKKCNHRWSYVAHGHNDKLYECTNCKLQKYE